LFWANLFVAPLTLGGLGLVHYFIAKYKFGIGAVVMLYIALLIISPLALLLMAIGFIDALLDLRQRLNFKQ